MLESDRRMIHPINCIFISIQTVSKDDMSPQICLVDLQARIEPSFVIQVLYTCLIIDLLSLQFIYSTSYNGQYANPYYHEHLLWGSD